jgi:hypothetical protein
MHNVVMQERKSESYYKSNYVNSQFSPQMHMVSIINETDLRIA